MADRPLMERKTRKKESKFDFKFFFAVLAMGVVIFLATITIIRWWQKLDLLDPWLRDHPRFNSELRKLQKETDSKANAPWLGAEAGVLDARMLLERAKSRGQTGPKRPVDWLPQQHWAMDVTAKVHPGHGSKPSGHSRSKTEAKTKQRHREWPQKRWPVTLADFVVAIPNHKVTEPQLKAGRSARLGMRTFVATNYSEDAWESYPRSDSETWGCYPDAEPVRSFYPGDDRAALTPFLAYKEMGETFKWMLYGDDDTVFFTDAALNLASTMDPELPYFVTDNLWWSPLFGGAWHPNPEAPRCLPCGYSKNVTEALGMSIAAGCPCTPAEICSLQDGYDGAFSETACGAPRSGARTYSLHGGAGALISIGLLRKVNWPSMERCVNHQWSSGGDAFLSQCLWEHGFAHTTPDPIWHPQKLTMFDPSPPGLNPDDYIIWKASHVLGNMLQQAAGVCSGLCKLEVDNTVSVHLRARRTGGSEEGAAAFIRAFARLSSRLTGRWNAASQTESYDGTDSTYEKLADGIDRDIETGILLVKAFSSRSKIVAKQQKNIEEEMGRLNLAEETGVLSARDAADSGIADSVATRILDSILQRVKHFERTEPMVDSEKAAGLPGDGLDDLVEETTKIAIQG